MNKTLTLTALVISLALSAQTRWDYEIGLRTPPPQGGMFGNFWNYQLLVKASPRKATAELGSGRWAWRLRTGQNTLSYSQSPNNNSFWVNTTSMLGFERLSRRGSFLKTYYGAEIGGSLNAYQGTNNGSLSYGPTATVLYGLRYRVKPRWTLAAEVAPSFGFWFSKYNDEWQVPMTQFNLSGQSIGISATYRI
jgi:hypothetical protein